MILIAGPCVIESEDHALKMAGILCDIADKYGTEFYFKASFDKANRSFTDSFRGPGYDKGIDILDRIKNKIGCRVTSDVHETWQVHGNPWAVLDLIQIPALLCKQTDLITGAAKTGKPINIKKGQFMGPRHMEGAVQKASKAGATEIMVTERGTMFGYNDLVVDMRSLIKMRSMCVPVSVIFDATHSTNGDSAYAVPLALAAHAVGIDGLFVECHDDPDNALCDGPSMLTPSEMEDLLKALM